MLLASISIIWGDKYIYILRVYFSGTPYQLSRENSSYEVWILLTLYISLFLYFLSITKGEFKLWSLDFTRWCISIENSMRYIKKICFLFLFFPYKKAYNVLFDLSFYL